MATVIDKLVIELGIDPKNMTKGQKDAVKDFKKSVDEMIKDGKRAEKAQKEFSESVDKTVRSVLGLYAVFLGGRGIKQFTQDIIGADAALGRFSVNMGTSPQQIAAWGMAVERVGGSSDALRATMQALSKSLYDLKMNGQNLPKELYQLESLTGVKIDPYHGVDKYMLGIAEAAKKLKDVNPSMAFNLLTALGIDPGTITLMEKYGSGLGKVLEEHRKLAADDKAIKAAQDLQEKWATLQQTAASLANTVMSTLGPQIEKILTQMTDWVEKNRDWINTKIVEGVQNFADYLGKIDWKAVSQGLSDFKSGANDIANALGGIVKASETILAIWAGGKIIGAIATVRTALGVGGAAAGATAAGAGGGGFLAGLMAFAAARLAGPAAFFYATGTNQGEDERMAANRERAKAMGWKPGDVSPFGPENTKEALFQHMRGRAVYGTDREDALNDYLNGPVKMPETTTDGKPVGKGNPMPVTIQTPTTGGGGGFWSTIGNAIGSFFGGSANAAEMPKSSAPQTSYRPSGDYKSGSAPTAKGEIADYIRQSATVRGINPDVALKVAMSEGGVTNPVLQSSFRRGGYREPSYGPFQLLLGGPGTGYGKGLGNAFMEQTGLDPRDPKNWKAAVDFALDNAKKSGWGAWYGAARVGIYGKYGIGQTPKTGVSGASGVLNANTATNNNTTNSSSVNANIGSVTVNTAATDAGGIAGGMVNGIKSQIPALANFGYANAKDKIWP